MVLLLSVGLPSYSAVIVSIELATPADTDCKGTPKHAQTNATKTSKREATQQGSANHTLGAYKNKAEHSEQTV